MNKVMSNKLLIALYISPALLLVLVLIFIPLMLSGYYGLMQWDGIGEKTFIGLENYIKENTQGVMDYGCTEQGLY